MQPTFSLESPYGGPEAQSTADWFKGDLHIHTVFSDGLYEPHQIKDFYKAYAYQFLAFSDHPNGGTVYHFDVDDDDFVTIPAYEFAADPLRVHINCIGAAVGPEGIHPAGPDMQGAVDRVNKQGGFAFFCHPFVYDYPNPAYVLTGLSGLEIINTGAISYRAGQDDAVRRGTALDLWDELLTKGQRLWGFVNSDFHWFCNEEPCVAFNMVDAPSLRATDLLQSLNAGRFYASTGLRLREILVEETSITVECEQAACIRFIGAGGNTLKESCGHRATYGVQGDEIYVRVECTDERRAFTTKPQLDFFHQTAFLQPTFVIPTRSS